ncbi:hypothetical protein LCGC14_0883410 [marine sediment metagenome]|uniref:Uncharacterized protein n=1 Tax=marine sediment metagenome TaxID=412755 RepID=A0A0F9PLU3_9ZZZZ
MICDNLRKPIVIFTLHFRCEYVIITCMKDKYSIEYFQQSDLMNTIEENFSIDIKQYLQSEYIQKQKFVSTIAKQLCISPGVITGWLRKFDIPIRSISASLKLRPLPFKSKLVLQIEQAFDEEIDTLLNRLYWDELLSQKGIANLLNTQTQTIGKWMKDFDVPTGNCVKRNIKLKQEMECSIGYNKTRGMCNFELEHSTSIEEFLYHQYWNLKKSICQISREYNLGDKTLRVWAKRISMPIRGQSESMQVVWEDEEFRNLQLPKAKRNFAKLRLKNGKSPTKPELLINALTPEYVRYTGNKAFWRRLPTLNKSSNPDFIIEPIKKTKQVIYFHGIYWHRAELYNRGQDLIDAWKDIDYDCLIIWEDELKDSVDNCLDKIASFTGQPNWQLQLPGIKE